MNYINTLATFYGECILLKEFNNFANSLSIKDKTTGEYIMKLCELYALDCLEKNQRSYLELGCSLQNALIIRDRHLKLCEELGEVSVNIIDAIAPNDRFVGSVIGNSDGQIYERMINAVESEKDVYTNPSWFHKIQEARNLIN